MADNNQGGFQKPQRKKNSFQNPKIKLAAQNPMLKQGPWATLGFDYVQNNPRLICDTKDPSLSGPENGYGRITAPLDNVVFMMIIEGLQQAIQAKEAMKIKIENSNHEFVNGQRSAEMSHLTDIWIGKDAEGQVFISVVKTNASNWPSIKFIFAPSDRRYHKFFKEDGSEFNKAELSIMAAKAYVRLLTGLLPSIADTHYYEAPPNPNWKSGGQGGGFNKGGQGGGGYNRGGNGGGGGYQQRPAAPPAAPAGDDIGADIPW